MVKRRGGKIEKMKIQCIPKIDTMYSGLQCFHIGYLKHCTADKGDKDDIHCTHEIEHTMYTCIQCTKRLDKVRA